MNPLSFLETCDRLAAMSPRHEADDRTILSRLYYAFFLSLLDGIGRNDQGFKAKVSNSGADHTLVRNFLKAQESIPAGKATPRGGQG